MTDITDPKKPDPQSADQQKADQQAFEPQKPAPKTTPRRFIAGAKCPACGLEDKIVMYSIDGQKFYECVKCGHKEAEASLAAAKPKTVVKDAAQPIEQVLTFHPFRKKDL